MPVLAGIFLLTFSQSGTRDGKMMMLEQYRQAEKLYVYSDNLSLRPGHTEAEEENMTRQTLDLFLQLIPAVKREGFDSLRFFCELKAAILYHYFDSLSTALLFYKQALLYQPRATALGIADSFFFKPALFAGSIFYTNDQFDSALVYYKKAEAIQSQYKTPIAESQRLFNRLGAMSFQSGNYSMARNYFEKALAELSPGDLNYEQLHPTYLNNIAASCLKMEEFSAADSIYRLLLPGKVNKDEVMENLGLVNLYLGNTNQALKLIGQVHYDDARSIRLLNNVSQALVAAGQTDSARNVLLQAVKANSSFNGNNKNIQHGLTLRYLGDLAAKENLLNSALQYYQQAIQQFYPAFSQTDIQQNPESFNGIFSYINLFETLIGKAGVLEKRFSETQKSEWLGLSLQTYLSAFRLADYVEKTYESDEARLFLNKIKYNVHDKPIQVCLRLYEQTKDKQYLEYAYSFDQRNKASILALNVKNNTISLPPGPSRELQQKSDALKAEITRLSLVGSSLKDSTSLRVAEDRIRDYEIQLSRIQEELNQLPEYRAQRFADFIPPVKEVQSLLDPQTTLVSYHLSETHCIGLVITKTELDYFSVPFTDELRSALDSFKTALHLGGTDEKFSGVPLARQLYKDLVLPIEKTAGASSRLIIIPDDELHYLPFEALENEKGEYLLEKYAVQYQYSTALLKADSRKAIINSNTLAFAPFIQKSFSDGSVQYPVLAETAAEVNTLHGKVFTNEAASRAQFLKEVNHYGILHLATHAVVNDAEPGQSVILFYPDSNGKKEYRVFAQEIYNLRLDSTDLVLLSACETGTGQLVRGEGLMSLSRAFAYAGCANIVTSLWKANDKTTSFLTRHFHQYLDKGYTKDRALQQAKLDLLETSEISPRLKSPPYWAHLVFIGNYTPASGSNKLPWLIGGILLLFVILVFFFVKRKKPGYR